MSAANARVWVDAANAPGEPDFDPPPASSSERVPSRLRIALVLSLLAHGVLLSLALGGDALGLPGLSFPWKERRLGADDLRIVLAPVPVPAPAAPAPAVSAPPVTAPVAPQSRSAPVVLPPPLPAPVTAAPARPEVNLPVAPDAPATRASADTVAPQPVAVVDDTAQKQIEQEAKARAIEQARTEQQGAQREAARLAAERQELARQEAARQEQVTAEARAQQEAARLDAERKEATRQEQARQAQLDAARKEQAQLEAARKAQAQQEAARQDTLGQEAARQDALRQEAARQEAVKQEAARQDAIRQAAARQDAANQEAPRQAQARQDQAQRERAEQEAKREERLRAIGQQMKQEAAQRDAAPTTSNLRRGWLFGRADANADLVEYAQAMSRKIEMNMTFDMVREAVKQPHAQPVVTVAVRADGTVEKVTFVVSSGVPAIDDAIRKVVESQAPYGRFPPALARQYDVVEIRRTWVFDMAIRLQ